VTKLKTGIMAAAVLLVFCAFIGGSECFAQRWDSSTSGDASNTRKALRESRLRGTEDSSRPWLGVFVKDAVEVNGYRGVRVESVMAGSPAEKAGVKNGDIITEVAGISVTSPTLLLEATLNLKIGAQYPITIIRDGNRTDLTIRTEPLPAGRQRFSQSQVEPTPVISDSPTPRKGPRDINVLKYALVDPKTRMVTFIGKYDAAYNTGPIPYDEYLRVALQHLYPSFSLDPSNETVESLKQAGKMIDADIARMDDSNYASQWAQRVADLLLNDPSLKADNTRFFKHCAEVLGITGEELKRMHDAATRKIDIPATEFMGLAAKMIRGIGLTRAGEALGVLAAGGTPEELLFNMAEKLGLSSQYKELALRGLAPDEFRKEEIILCISEICRCFEAPENEIQSKIAAIRAGGSADLIIDYMGKKLSEYITNKSGRRMINGLILGPELMAKLYRLPLPKAELVFDDLPPDSLLGDVFFKSDYRLKSVCTFPDAREKLPAHMTQHEMLQKEASAAMNKRLCNVDFMAGNRLVPGEVALRVSPSGNVVEFGHSRVKVLGWIIEMHSKADSEITDFISTCLTKYADYLTDHYDDYSKVYPEWHKFSEAAKVIALARWAKNNGFTLNAASDSATIITQPKYIDGFWSAVFEVGENSQYLTFIAEGGASFAKNEGEGWIKTQPDVAVTTDVSKQLAASAVFAEQALGAAVVGDLESARELAEKSARAMAGEVDITRLPSLDGVPVPADPASYAAATGAAIDEVAQCLEKISSASKDLERAQQIAVASPDEAARLKQESVKSREDAQARLNQILDQVRNYKSDPSKAGAALIALRSDTTKTAPIGGNQLTAAGGASSQTGPSSTATDTTSKSYDWSKTIQELDEVNKKIAETREVLLRLNASIQSDRKLFEEWESSASEGIDRCVSTIGDIALDVGIGGLKERHDTIYELAKKLPGKPEDVIEKYRFLASLTQRMSEAKAVNDLAGLAAKENKTEAELWETLRDGISQLSGLFSLDQTFLGKWWKYGVLASDTAYNLTELRLTWKNLQTLEANNERYAEAVRKLSARMKELVERQKEIRKKLEAGGMPDYTNIK